MLSREGLLRGRRSGSSPLSHEVSRGGSPRRAAPESRRALGATLGWVCHPRLPRAGGSRAPQLPARHSHPQGRTFVPAPGQEGACGGEEAAGCLGSLVFLPCSLCQPPPCTDSKVQSPLKEVGMGRGEPGIKDPGIQCAGRSLVEMHQGQSWGEEMEAAGRRESKCGVGCARGEEKGWWEKQQQQEERGERRWRRTEWRWRQRGCTGTVPRGLAAGVPKKPSGVGVTG